MSQNDVRETISTAPLPSPRTAGDDAGPSDGIPAQPPAPRPPAPSFPWPEPWHSSRAARPRTEFWDVESASWRSRGPVRRSGTAD
jgi:hypothetical protein